MSAWFSAPVVRAGATIAEAMTDDPRGKSGPADGAKSSAGLPRWKLVLIAFAALLLLVGVALYFAGGGEPQRTPVQPGTAGASFIELGGGEATQGQSWAPGLMRMGFSFFVAFAIGSVFRSFFKISLLCVGIYALLTLGLQHLGYVTVHWDQLEGMWAGFTDRVSEDFGRLRTAITGSLPQAGLASVGLFAGFKKG